MPRYVDGFVLPLPKKGLVAYRKLATRAAKIWREHGALEYREAVLQDANANGMVEFPALAKAKKGETVIFAWIVYKSRAHRDQVIKRVMKDPRLCQGFDPKKMPFDCMRMSYGGFSLIVER